MSEDKRSLIRKEVMVYLQSVKQPASLFEITYGLRGQNTELSNITPPEVRDVVQPMIVTGVLKYTAGLKVAIDRGL